MSNIRTPNSCPLSNFSIIILLSSNIVKVARVVKGKDFSIKSLIVFFFWFQLTTCTTRQGSTLSTRPSCCRARLQWGRLTAERQLPWVRHHMTAGQRRQLWLRWDRPRLVRLWKTMPDQPIRITVAWPVSQQNILFPRVISDFRINTPWHKRGANNLFPDAKFVIFN